MGVRGTVGRFVYNVQVAPPSVVLSTDGSCANPVGPTIQQVVAVGQSMANAHHGALAQSAGVLSVQVLPPSVVSATAGQDADSDPETFPESQFTQPLGCYIVATVRLLSVGGGRHGISRLVGRRLSIRAEPVRRACDGSQNP
jgi:hypothetical protein